MSLATGLGDLNMSGLKFGEALIERKFEMLIMMCLKVEYVANLNS